MSSAAANLKEQVRKHDEILQSCRKRKVLFTDPEFPADDRSIQSPDPNLKTLQWLRPKEIDPKAKFIVDGFSRFDVKQGAMGDCWILAAFSGIAGRSELIARVIPEGQSLDGTSYCGAFRFRLYKFGEEIEILVDDRLPTQFKTPVFTRPLNSEFWVCLLEKAFAKLHGCYQALDRGNPNQALADLTGGVSEIIRTDNKLATAKYISACLRRNSIVTAPSIHKPDGFQGDNMKNNLVYGHAYTVTGVQLRVRNSKTGREVDLIRLHNPWGMDSYTGEWSDTSEAWSEELKQSVQLKVNENDGEFWMSFDDFLKYFSFLLLMHFANIGKGGVPSPGSHWRQLQGYGKWERGLTSGGTARYRDTHFKNPQFVIDLTDCPHDDDELATLLVCLEEPDQRVHYLKQTYITKGVYLYKLNAGEKMASKGAVRVAKGTPFNGCREVVYRFDVKPGRYAVMACTGSPEEEAKFLLRVLAEA